MNKILAFLILILATFSQIADAETVTQIADVQAQLGTMFILAFDTTSPGIMYSTTLPFGTIDATKPLCYPAGRSEGDGKSDTGIRIATNLGVDWYIKLDAVPISSPYFPMQYFKFYMSQPVKLSGGFPSDGTLNFDPPGWRPIPTSPTLVYTSSIGERITYGILATFSFAIDPSHLPGGTTNYSVKITYTLTTVL